MSGPANLSVTLLGTGTPTPSLRRMSSGYLIRSGSNKILFDHGFGAYHRLLEIGVRSTEISHLFLSHLHYDHMGDVPRLVLTRWDQGAGKVDELKVFGPKPVRQVFSALFDRTGAFGPDLVARTEDRSSLDVYAARGGVGTRRWPEPDVGELTPGDVVADPSGWKVRVGRAEHFTPLLNCLAFRFEAHGRSIVYSGDSGPSEQVKELAAGADVLIHMCHYLSGTAPSADFARSCCGHMELAELAAEARVRTVVLTHITQQFDQPRLRERVVRDMASTFSGDIVFGEDGMTIPSAIEVPPRLD